MIEGIFILSGDTGDVVLEKHYKGAASRAAVEAFWEEVTKRPRRDDVPPIINTPRFYLVNIYRGGLYMLATLTGEIPSLLVIEFLHRAFDVMADYFGGDVTPKALTGNFSTAYLLLEEMLDNGHPLITEPNALHSLIAPPSVIGRIANFVTGKASNLGETLGESAMSVIPWRKAGVKHTQNEVFFDINEEIDVIFDGNGTVVSSGVRGTIECRSHLSGVPDLTLLFVNPSAIIDDCAFHPCVRFARWEREQCVSFVPPDGNFTLMQYRAVSDKANGQCPVFCRPVISWRDGSARASFVLGVKPFASSTGGPGAGTLTSHQRSSSSFGSNATLIGPTDLPIEDVQLVIYFPDCIKTVDLTADIGTVAVDPKTNVVTWTLSRFPKDKSPELSGTIYVAPGVSTPPVESPHAVLRFSLPNQTASGLTVRDLLLTNEKYKFFKGIKNSLRSGTVQIRT